MNSSANYSDIEFAIQNNAVRYAWATYQLFVLLSTLIGDTLVLAATFQQGAFKINKLIVTVIQHIAVSNLVNSISYVLPVATSLLANRWVLGHAMCRSQSYLTYFINPASLCLVAVLTTFKFLILRKPLQAASWSIKRAHQVCAFMWAFSALLPMLMFASDEEDVHFDYRIYNCRYDFNDEFWKIVLPLKTFVSFLAPNTVVILTTIPTLRYLMTARKSARRFQGRVPWQGALTVALTAFINTISTLPAAFYHMFTKFFEVQESPISTRICTILVMVNIMANFYIYCLTITSFWRFLLSKVQLLVSLSLHSTVYTAEHRTLSGATGNDLFLTWIFCRSQYLRHIRLWYLIFRYNRVQHDRYNFSEQV